MHHLKTWAFVGATLCLNPVSAFSLDSAVSFDWAVVGNPGNPGELSGFNNGPEGTKSLGGVDYAYRISKHEVTNAQYTKFLNAADPTGENSLGLYNTGMSSDSQGGINFDPLAPDGQKYGAKAGRALNPVVYVSIFDAMRFVNWFANGQGDGDTETGAYSLDSSGFPVRSADAHFFLPTEDEWYKAAYHKNDGATSNYWDFATASDELPAFVPPQDTNASDATNAANWGYAVTNGARYDPHQNYLTDVGAYTQSVSPYGTYDQTGNAAEWVETLSEPSLGIFGGGSWGSIGIQLPASRRNINHPLDSEYRDGTFRVAASVPTPTAASLAALACVGALGRRRR